MIEDNLKCTSKNVVGVLTKLIANIKHNQASRKIVATMVDDMCEKLKKANFFEKRKKEDPRVQRNSNV